VRRALSKRLWLAFAVALVAVSPALAKKAKTPAASALTIQDADRWVASPPGDARDRALRAWIPAADLADLMFVLRQPPEVLGAYEAPLVRAALERCVPSREALHRRLLLRSALADPARAKKDWGELGALAPAFATRARASVFRLGALLPDSGHYEPYARAVLAGIDAALADANSVSPHPLERRVWSTGGDTPERAAAALDSAGTSAGVLVGELLSVPTLAIASGARLLELPLVSPTATDEAIGRVGPSVFQVGPSGAARGEALALAVLKGGAKHVGVLTADDLSDGSFARGFADAATAAGASVDWRGTFAPGTPDFRATSRLLITKKLDALFFDGEARDAAALLRQLTKDQVVIQLCGGEGLSPDEHHADTRVLLEGVTFVAEDWRVPQGIQARLDSLAQTIGEERGGSLFVRGYYAGRMVAAAVASGALAPEEVTAFLREHLDPRPLAAASNFLDCAGEGAKLRLYTVERGKAVALP